MNVWGIVLAAGSGSRFAAAGFAVAKQFIPFEGLPLFWRSVQTLARVPHVRGCVVVLPPSDDADALASAHALLEQCIQLAPVGVPVVAAIGGARRQDSVRLGLQHIGTGCETVLVHDAARPFFTASLCGRIITALEQGQGAVVPGVPLADTIKVVDATGTVKHTPPRETLRAVQTPQGFHLPLLARAHAQAEREAWEVTDDASLVERMGEAVFVVAGEAMNQKITTAQDRALLQSAAPSQKLVPCTGFGYDVHRYGGERPFILGGVPIATPVTIAAHSDGDTLLHALIDALLGCIGGGDIGTLFPDNDPAYAGISSGLLLAEVLERTRRAGLVLYHVDMTIVAQTPKIAPHREAIARNVAKLLELPVGFVNVKATTEEKLGFTGDKKGLKAIAVVTAARPVL